MSATPSLYWVHPVLLESKQSTGSSPPVLHSKLVHLPCLVHFLHLSVKTNKSAQSGYRKQSQETQLAPRYITKHKHKPQLCTLSDTSAKCFMHPDLSQSTLWDDLRIVLLKGGFQEWTYGNRSSVGSLQATVTPVSTVGSFSWFESGVLFVWHFVSSLPLQSMAFKAWKTLTALLKWERFWHSQLIWPKAF